MSLTNDAATLAGRVKQLQEERHDAIRSHNRHRTMLSVMCMLAVGQLLGHVGHELYRAHHAVTEGAADGTTAGSESGNKHVHELAHLALLSFSTQGIFLVSVIALLIVRRAETEGGDRAELTESARGLEEMSKEVAFFDGRIKAMAPSIKPESMDAFVDLIEHDPGIGQGLSDQHRDFVNRFKSARGRFESLSAGASALAQQIEAMRIRADRWVVAYSFGLLAVATAAVPFVVPEVLESTSASEVYLAMTAISNAALAAAHALIGRRRTDEATFLKDIGGLATTVGVLRGLVRGDLEPTSEAKG